MKHITLCIGLLTLALLGTLAGSAMAESDPEAGKVALVIGNGAYRFQDPLETADADTARIAWILRDLGFEVIERTDLGNGAFRAALNDFSKRLRPGGIALFYYMGYAVQVEGGNFLLPVGNELRRATDRITQAISLNAVLHLMDSSQARAKVVLLDAAYPDRISASQDWSAAGLAATKVRDGASLIAFSARPGSEIAPTPDGSLFAKELVAGLAQPGAELTQILNQVSRKVQARSNGAQRPWIGPGFEGRIVLGGPAPEATAPEPESPVLAGDHVAQSNAATGEQELVRPGTQPTEVRPTVPRDPAVSEDPKPRAEAVPPGTKTLSQVTQETARAPSQPPGQAQPSAEAAFEQTLSRRERGQIQRDLKDLGFYRGAVDRVFGPGTRSGIRKLQEELDEIASGTLTAGQRESLGARAEARRHSIQNAAQEAAQEAAANQAATKTAPAQTAVVKPATPKSDSSNPGQSSGQAAQEKAPAKAPAPPFSSAQDAKAFLETRGDIKAVVQRYNKTKFLVEHQGSFKVSYIDSLKVNQVAGDRITARIKFTVASRRRNSSSGTFDFIILWRESGIEILSHARK